MFDHRHSNIADWITHALNNLNTEDLIYMAAIAYGIWFARNQMIFESTEMDDDKVINNATKCIQEFQRATQIPSSESINTNYDTSSNHRPRLRPTTNKHWSRPNEGTIKVNCDANLSREGRWGLGAIFRDSDGEILAAATWELPGTDDATLAEACALYKVVSLAYECCFMDVSFESDNSSIVLMLNEDRIPRNYVGNFIRGINCNREYFRNCSFKHIGREANKAAHGLALLAHDEPNRVWLEETPPQIVSILLRDLIHQ
jgi:hypothetical protein